MTSSTLDIISHSSAQTQRLGTRLGELLRGGELILLDGKLGTGKTTFTQGLAQGLGITEVVNSPTFTLLKEYPGQPRGRAEGQGGGTDGRQVTSLPPLQQAPLNVPTHAVGPGRKPGHVPTLYHFDFYRLDNPDEILDLGFEDYFYGSGVCVVEWADKILRYVQDDMKDAQDDIGIWPSEHLRIRMKMLSETKRNLLFTAIGVEYSELLRQFQKNSYAATSS